MIASIAVDQSWLNTTDRPGRTAPARRAFDERFVRQVDPDGTLDPTERARLAEIARRLHFKKLALRSVQARAARKAAG